MNIDVRFYVLLFVAALWNPIAVAAPECDLPTGQFCVNYYDNILLSGTPSLRAYEPAIAHDWEHSGPRQTADENQFSARWQGRFLFDDGQYNFTIFADDGVRIWLDDQLITDEWRDQDVELNQTVAISAGYHNLRIEYYDSWWVARLNVSWQRQAERHIPGPQVVPDIPINTDNINSPAGTNTIDVRYWQTRWLFLDAMKRSSEWLTQCADWMPDGCQPEQPANGWNTLEQDQLDLDENGWVRSLPTADDNNVQYRWVSKVMFLDAKARYPAGQYIVLYDGEGTLAYDLDAVKNEALSVPGRDVVEVNQPTNMGMMLQITQTDPDGVGNYLRNIRVILPGGLCNNDSFSYCEPAVCSADATCTRFEDVYEAQIFHPLYLQELRKFKVLRMMGLLGILWGDVSSLENSPKLSDHRWSTANGIPIETVIELARRLNVDPWFNMPARTDDAYIRYFAEQALANLHSNQRVYLEYHNEISNNAMPFENAGAWVEARAQEEWSDELLRDVFNLPSGFVVDGFFKRLNWYGKRSVEICEIWKSVWSQAADGQDNSDRISCVLGTHPGMDYVAREQAACIIWAATGGQACADSMDAMAIAAYFGYYVGTPIHEQQVNDWLAAGIDSALDNLFHELEFGGLLYDETHPADERAPQDGAMGNLRNVLDTHVQIANQFELPLITYEGGQHLAPQGNVVNNDVITTFFNEANRDPRMGVLYTQMLSYWRSLGDNLFMNFNHVEGYNRWLSFGSMEYHGQTNAPKFQALMQYIDENPICWNSCE